MSNILEKEIERQPLRSILMLILLSTLALALVEPLLRHRWISMLLIFAVALAICLPMAVGRFSKIKIPVALEMFFVIFIYASLFLGELNGYYAKYDWWDTLWHTSSGLAIGVVGFLILYILHRAEKVKASPKTIAMFTFAFALCIGALWEIVEFTIDSSFGITRMQGGSLHDTMWDLIVDSFGGLFSAVMGYIYLKHESGIVVKQVTKEFKKDNPLLFQKVNKKR